ncbi:hypothetical protein EUX98_g3183 [Antrodiella citrinella]|uniref:mRNA 3'-end-processing protein RNA14 n=1 Tax=Antrodiella citrinella TaxID=2447956 RepID=A0A4S4MX64_9APHY|nr:hypothetical protein EUX98_g3183 [Antrodiella citrinella]
MQSFVPHFPLGNEDFGATRDNSSASSAPNDDGKTQLTEDQIKILHKLMHSSQSQEIHFEPDHSYRQLPQDTKPQVAPRPRTAWLQTRVHEKPRDAESWIELISLVRVAKDHDKIVDTYEAALQAFPNTPSLQISYLMHVSESSVPTKWQTVATLLNRFLKTSPFPELWRFYISHVSAHGTVRKAYEFALNHVGHDPESGDIWSDYIHFLKTVEADIWNEGCQTDILRMAYQCAIQAPTAHANKLWQQYCEFEAAAADPQSVEKIIAAHQVVHTQACKAYGALQACVGDLFSAPTADQDLLRLPRVPIFFADEKALMSKWRQYLKWEEGNPLSYDDHARSRLYTRVQAAYRKAVVLMRFYPEVWYMAYAWTNLVANEPGLPDSKREEKKDEAMEYLKSGVHANPRSFVLNFAYAEVLEEANDLPAVHDVYQTFISALRTELEAEGSQGSPVTGTSLDDPSSQPSKFMGKADMKDDKRTQFGTAWIMYMRFARRAESSKAARDVFSKARKDNWVTWKVYEAAALMEYHCTKAADVATRIFHKAMEKFPTEEQLALQYLEFLISINDDSNARALFERVIAMFAPEKARVLWNRWMRYEYQYGTFPATQELEKRIAQVYPNGQMQVPSCV